MRPAVLTSLTYMYEAIGPWILRKRNTTFREILINLVFNAPLTSLGHMETEHRFIVLSDRLEKPGIELATTGLQV